MAKFTYNNTKNASIGYTLFELNYGYYPRILFKEDINSCSISCFINKLAGKLKKLIKFTSKTYFIYKNYEKELMIKK